MTIKLAPDGSRVVEHTIGDGLETLRDDVDNLWYRYINNDGRPAGGFRCLETPVDIGHFCMKWSDFEAA